MQQFDPGKLTGSLLLPIRRTARKARYKLHAWREVIVGYYVKPEKPGKMEVQLAMSFGLMFIRLFDEDNLEQRLLAFLSGSAKKREWSNGLKPYRYMQLWSACRIWEFNLQDVILSWDLHYINLGFSTDYHFVLKTEFLFMNLRHILKISTTRTSNAWRQRCYSHRTAGDLELTLFYFFTAITTEDGDRLW